MNLYIERRDGTYLDYTANWLGIVNHVYADRIISFSPNYIIPYIFAIEGFISNINTINFLNEHDNVDVYYNELLVFKKRISNNQIYDLHCSDVYNLYDPDDFNIVQTEINYWETNKDNFVYLRNTENINDILQHNTATPNIAGLASGTIVAEFAYSNKSQNIIFFDYSLSSLEFQKELIYSSDRKQVLLNFSGKLITGQTLATVEDINKIDIEFINIIYDYIQTQTVEFIHCDLRNTHDIHSLFNMLNCTFTLWISNVFYYVTSFNNNKQRCIELINELSALNNVNLIPFMTIRYEN